jgi:putative methyltransferase (TIGR04325 family)
MTAHENSDGKATWTQTTPLKKSRIIGAVLRRMSRYPAGLALLRSLRTLPLTRAAYIAVVGYNRTFASLRDAEAAIGSAAHGGHGNVFNVELHLKFSLAARPSDYSALFHLRPIISSVRRVFDLGGNVGNLYYCYSKYLQLPRELIWQVLDLPDVIDAGEKLAAERGVSHLAFVSSWEEASGADVLIASGSLHYFEVPLPQMLAKLPILPKYILINRTPLTEGATVSVVQDGGAYRVACMLYNRFDLIRELERLDYLLMDQWDAAELSIDVPGFPEHSVRAYSGLFLCRRPAPDADKETLP